MEFKNKLSLGAKRVEYLMEEYFDREKTLGYCKACPNFSQYWSCPPYAFDEAIFLKQFKYMHIIGRQFEVSREDLRNVRDPQAVKDYCTDKLQAIKVMTWKTLLDIENEVDGVIGLIPGNCPICETQGLQCARKTGESCRFPNMMRFSLESLGFNVTELLKYEVGMTIQWGDTYRLPEVLTSVSAILCNEEIPQEILKKYFPDKKKSWVRDNRRTPDNEFHTSELIKPEETIHGNREALQARRVIIDDEIPPYKPQKSWVGYKAERDPKDEKPKLGYTVTIQGEEPEEVEKTPEALEAEKIYDEDATPKIKKEAGAVEVVTVMETPDSDEEEIEAVAESVTEEDDAKYQWLGFKASLDDDEIVKRPIPKMSELIPEEEEAAETEAVQAEEPEEILSAPPVAEPVLEAVPEAAETMAEAEEIIAEAPEEDDSKYQWLGFKRSVDEEEEPIVTKSSLSTLVIPE